MAEQAIRPAVAEDARACAKILNDWIDNTPWMPRVRPAKDVELHYREFVLPTRSVFVTGDPLVGYISFNSTAAEITSLYCKPPGRGTGKLLLDHIKQIAGCPLELWTFVANTDARRFYKREGFVEVRRTEGDNEEGLPDVLLRWTSDSHKADMRNA